MIMVVIPLISYCLFSTLAIVVLLSHRSDLLQQRDDMLEKNEHLRQERDQIRKERDQLKRTPNHTSGQLSPGPGLDQAAATTPGYTSELLDPSLSARVPGRFRGRGPFSS